MMVATTPPHTQNLFMHRNESNLVLMQLSPTGHLTSQENICIVKGWG
jgi:hypothetical protein